MGALKNHYLHDLTNSIVIKCLQHGVVKSFMVRKNLNFGLLGFLEKYPNCRDLGHEQTIEQRTCFFLILS